jgi:hypothetical protein
MDNLQEAYLSVYQELDEVSRGAGQRMTNWRKQQEQDAHMKRVKDHQERMANDPEYRKKHTINPWNRGSSQEGRGQNESYDLFDYLLEYLVAEGYADTNENAIAIMANMSEEWREEILDEAVRGSQRSIADRITGNDIRKVTRGNKDVYKKPKWKDAAENEVQRGSQLRKKGETENTNDRRDRERIEANRKSIKRLNAKPGADDGSYDAGYHGDDDTSGGERHYSLSRTNQAARRRRASGR